MTIKDILVQMDSGAACAARLDLAVGLAQLHEAHLTALCVFDLNLVPGAGYSAMGFEYSTALIEQQSELRDNAFAAAAKVEAIFRERLRREGLPGEWRLVEGAADAAIGLQARYADLVILGQGDPNQPGVAGWTPVIEQVLFTAGRPVLVVPYAGRFAQIGRQVLVGWDAGREATRAVHDALPLMHKAEAVTVLAIDAHSGLPGHGEEPTADICAHLARHGLPVTGAQTSSDGLDAADILLNYAADLGADLIVIGGYGHSRFREMVLGGMTRGLLKQMTVPVLLSH